jgi:quinol monooxygenase YgiN
VREEPGCEQYELFVSTERPDNVVLLERWSDADTLQAHLELNQKRPSVIQQFVDGRATLERFDV